MTILKNKAILLAALVAMAVIIAGVVFLQMRNGSPVAGSQLISPTEYQSEFVTSGTTHLLVDVRTPEEYASGHIPGSVNIELGVLESRLDEIPQDVPVVLYCRSGNRSGQAAELLVDKGYTNILDLGGITTWAEQGYPVE